MARVRRWRSRMSPMNQRRRGSSPSCRRTSYCLSSSRLKTTRRRGSWCSSTSWRKALPKDPVPPVMRIEAPESRDMPWNSRRSVSARRPVARVRAPAGGVRQSIMARRHARAPLRAWPAMPVHGHDAVADLAAELGARVVRGSEDDVLSRFVLARSETGADAVVRLTADCPLADPALISSVVALWRADTSLDYVASTLVRTLPRGLDVELASSAALAAADAEATDYHRTHVTSYLYAGDREFRRAGLVVQPAADDLRVTLDTVEDAAALDAVVAELGDRPPRWHEVVALLRARPDIVGRNAGVVQKALADG